MDRGQLESRLRNVFAGVLGLAPADIQENACIDEPPEWDSLSHLRLILAIEEEFSVRFDMEKIPQMVSFAAVADEVEEALGR